MSGIYYAKIPIAPSTHKKRMKPPPICQTSTGNAKVISVHGDITLQSHTLIVHQTNCVSTGAKGLAKSIFEKFPCANTYGTKRTFGSVSFHPSETVVIVNIYGQKYPGCPKTETERKERQHAFQQALCILSDICIAHGVRSVSFPKNIGCGLAGGDWSLYSSMINEFAARLPTYTIVHIVSNV